MACHAPPLKNKKEKFYYSLCSPISFLNFASFLNGMGLELGNGLFLTFLQYVLLVRNHERKPNVVFHYFIVSATYVPYLDILEQQTTESSINGQFHCMQTIVLS